MFSIQSTNLVTLTYTPGRWGSAHPSPNDVTPTKKHLSPSSNVRGPPESPCKNKFKSLR